MLTLLKDSLNVVRKWWRGSIQAKLLDLKIEGIHRNLKSEITLMNLMAIKSKSKIKFIIRNPRFFINVKEQIKKSVKALSGAKIGTRFNRNAVPRTIESQRDKVTSKNIISIIRRENMQTDSRPFSAFPLN